MLPQGNTLPREVWLRRHRALLILLWLQALGLTIYALFQGFAPLHALGEGGIVALFAAAAALARRSRLASTLVSVGLMSASGVMVHISGGLVEAHFYFFVMIVLLTLYEDWVPFLIAAAYVLLHHGVAGMLDPATVYNHPDAIAHPWKWAGIHAIFVTAAGAAGVIAWRLNEDYRAETQSAYDLAKRSEHSLAEAQDLAEMGSFEWDPSTNDVAWSRGLRRLIGMEDGTTPSFETYMAGLHPDDRERVERLMTEIASNPQNFELEYRYLRPDGAVRSFQARGEVVSDNGSGPRIVGTVQDFTERQRVQAQIIQRADAQAAVAVLGEQALAGGDLALLFREAVVCVSRVLGVEIVAVVERAADDFIVRAGIAPGADMVGVRVPAGMRSQAGFTLASDRPVIVGDWDHERRFEKPRVLREHAARSGATVVIKGRAEAFGVLGMQSLALRDFDEDDVNFLQSVANVLAAAIDRSSSEEEIRHQAVHDPLTGLPNRNLFSDRCSQALKHAHLHGTSIAVLFLDLDQFKLVNDSFGHEAGDDLLQAVAPRISDSLKPGDTVARFGGDEFAVLIEDVDSERDAIRAAERIAAALSRPFAVGSRDHFATATIGIAISDGSGSPEELIRDADSAMYRAKARGRGRYEIFDAVMRAKVVEHLQLENDLRMALERDELTLHYQPIVSLRSGKIAGLEALVRWNHPERGLLPPGEFITLAEESGLIVPLGSWVLDNACRQAAAWHAELPDSPPIGISVNLSGLQLADSTLPGVVEKALGANKLEPTTLSLEVTETVLLQGDPVSAALDSLRSLGVGLVLDDFGTGFSSPGSLKRFPFSALKVDRSFVSELGEASADTAIFGAMTAIADALDLEVVAEGVETEEQLEAVRGLDCDYAQGYYFARPAPAEHITTVLRAAAPARPQQLAG